MNRLESVTLVQPINPCVRPCKYYYTLPVNIHVQITRKKILLARRVSCRIIIIGKQFQLRRFSTNDLIPFFVHLKMRRLYPCGVGMNASTPVVIVIVTAL